jgi:arylsulfatase A-like enzyme
MTNILLLISDQHRADYVGYRGDVPVSTPNIDALVARGLAWDRAMTPAPLCGPARAALFTGKYPHQLSGELLPDHLGARSLEEMPLGGTQDMMINDSVLRDPPELTRQLRKAGYHTAYAGKWHLGNDVLSDWFDVHAGEDNQQYIDWLEDQGLPLEGWPLNDPEVRSSREPHMSIPRAKKNPLDSENTNDPWITDLALEMLKDRPKGKPFFQVVGLNGPHPPFKVSEPYYSMYDPASFSEPSNFHPGPDEPISKNQSFYRRLWHDHGEDWDEWARSAAVYAGFCTQIDAQLGRLTDALKVEGVLDDTLVIYTSDHGEMLGQHGLWHKMQPYEMSLRVPLVMAGPRVKSTGSINRLASLADLPSTILHAAGLDGRKIGTGRDLRNPESEAPDFWFSEQEPLGKFHGETDWRLVTDGHWKMIWNRDDRLELYNLNEDIDEIRNLAGQPESTVQENRLKKVLLIWMADTGDKLREEAERSLQIINNLDA